MTLNTDPFRTLFDAMNDSHSNPDVPLTYPDTNSIPTTSAPPVSDRDEASEADLTQTVIRCKLGDITRLRDMALRANESWPPSASWLAGFRSGFANGYAARRTR